MSPRHRLCCLFRAEIPKAQRPQLSVCFSTAPCDRLSIDVLQRGLRYVTGLQMLHCATGIGFPSSSLAFQSAYFVLHLSILPDVCQKLSWFES